MAISAHAPPQAQCRIGVDIGGTFADMALEAGGRRIIHTSDHLPQQSKGRQTVGYGDRLVLELPGGGYGPPRERDPELVRQDLIDGLISARSAREDYLVAFDDRGQVDQAEPRRLRET